MTTSDMFAVCVTFRIFPDKSAAFLPLMMEQAENSLSLEPGCHQFDVCTSEDLETVFLYELYSDGAAFEAHLQSDHFKRFDAAVKDLVAAKNVRTFTRIARSAPKG